MKCFHIPSDIFFPDQHKVFEVPLPFDNIMDEVSMVLEYSVFGINQKWVSNILVCEIINNGLAGCGKSKTLKYLFLPYFNQQFFSLLENLAYIIKGNEITLVVERWPIFSVCPHNLWWCWGVINNRRCYQDQFFANLIFWGVRGSGHGLVVRPKGYVAKSRFPKGRKANRGCRQRFQDYLVKDWGLCTSTDESRVDDWAEIRWGSILFTIWTEATTDRVHRFIYVNRMFGVILSGLGILMTSTVCAAQWVSLVMFVTNSLRHIVLVNIMGQEQ